MDATAFISQISVIFTIKPGATHAGLSLHAAGEPAGGGATGGKMLTLSVAVSGKGKDGRVSPVLPRARRGAFPLAPLGSGPAVAGRSDFEHQNAHLFGVSLGKFGFLEGKAPGTSLCTSPLKPSERPDQIPARDGK